MADDLKSCNSCEQLLPISAFGKNATKHDGVQPKCKTCTREYGIVWRASRAKPNVCLHCNAEYPRIPARHQPRLCELCRESLAWCCRCKRVARPDELRKIKAGHICRDCQTERGWQHSYGLTRQNYEGMLAEQSGVCAICARTTKRNLAVDHDHDCCPGKTKTCGRCIRGLLCNRCNGALGWYEKNRSIIEAYVCKS